MNEYFALLIVDVVFLMISFVFQRLIVRSKHVELSVLCAIVYFIGIVAYFGLVEKIHQYLRDHKIYIEWGHASLLLVMDMFACMIFAFVLIIFAFIKRARKSQ